MSLEIQKTKKIKNPELKKRRLRLFRWAVILLITWYSLQNLPNPEISEPKYSPKIEERISKLNLGDTSSFDKLEAKLKKTINTSSPALTSELEKEIDLQRKNQTRNFKILHEKRLSIMRINDINYKINDPQFDASYNGIDFNYIKYLRQIFDPTLNFMELFSDEEKIREMESNEYIKHHSDFYVESRVPEILQNEMQETFKQVRDIQKKIKDLSKILETTNEADKKELQEGINNYKNEVKYIYLQHQIRLYNDILPYFTKSNQEVPEYTDIGDELVKRLYSVINKTINFFDNLLKDEIIIEVGTIYSLFALEQAEKYIGFHLFEYLKGNFFKGLYLKALLTSGVNNSLQKVGRFFETAGDKFYKFQNIVLERDNFPKIRIFNEGRFNFEATVNYVKVKITDFFDQTDTRFTSKSKVNLIFGDIRYFRDMLLNTKMILQFPMFFIEKENVELAWDMIADGDAPFLRNTFKLSEDGKRLNYSLQVLTRATNEVNFTRLLEVLNSLGFHYSIAQDYSSHSQLISSIHTKINEVVSKGDEKSLGELRQDICLIRKLIRHINKYGLEKITLLNIFFSRYKSLASDMEVKAVTYLKDKDLNLETSSYHQKRRSSSFKYLSDESREYINTDIFSYFDLTPYHFDGKYLKFVEISETTDLKIKSDINSTFNSIYNFEFMNFLVHLQAREMVYKIRGIDIIETIINHTIKNLSNETIYTDNDFLSSLSKFVSKDSKDFLERKKSIFI